MSKTYRVTVVRKVPAMYREFVIEAEDPEDAETKALSESYDDPGGWADIENGCWDPSEFDEIYHVEQEK